jgi:hypothetical protein
VFLGAKSPHRCRLPGEGGDAVYQPENTNFSSLIPWDAAEDRLEQCRM